MVRPRYEQPTPAELELLKLLWNFGRPASVREVMASLNQEKPEPRAYTTVMSLLNVMAEKGLLKRTPQGREYLYVPVKPRENTLRSLLGQTLTRVYDGSASLLVAHLLDQSHPDVAELDQIQDMLNAYRAAQPNSGSNRKDGPGCGPSKLTD